MLTAAEKTDTRRFCGYPVLGVQTPHSHLDQRLIALASTEAAVLRDYLITLRQLEQAIPATGESLDTAQIATWSRNANETRDRTRLFDNWRRRLCEFLGIPPGAHMPRSGVNFIV